MTQKNFAAATPSTPATPPLYNTGVHLPQNPRAVMEPVPRLTGSSNDLEDVTGGDKKDSLWTTKPRYSSVVTDDDGSNRRTWSLSAGGEYSTKGNRRGLRTSLAPPPLWSLPTEDRHSTTSPITPTAPSRSSGGFLISPRPSPTAKHNTRVERASFRNVSSPLEVDIQPQRSGYNMDSVTVGGACSAVLSRPRLMSPSQHHLVYDNNTQHWGTSSSHVSAAFALAQNEELQLGSSPTACDFPLTSDTGQKSPRVSLFSVPAGDKNSPFSASSLIPGVSSSSPQQQSSGNRIVSISERRHGCLRVRGNEDCPTTAGQSEVAAETTRPYPPQRCRSAPSGLMAPVSSNVTHKGKRLHRTRTSSLPLTQSTPSNVCPSCSKTSPKAVILRELQALQLQKELFMLMEHETKGRRSILDAYLEGARELVVDFTFRRLMILAQGDTTSSSPLKCDKVGLTSSGEVILEDTQKKGTVTRVVKDVPQSGLSRLRTPGPTSGKLSQHHGGAHVSTTKSSQKVSKLLPEASCASVQQCQRKGKKKEEGEKEGTKRHISKHSKIDFKGEMSQKGVVSLYVRVRENVDDAERATCLLESQLLCLLAEEFRCREHIIGEETTAFHFLFCYHRIMEGAFQPSVIILQEVSQWHSILIEATNAFHRLQESRFDFELEREIQSAREQARRLTGLVKRENHARFVVFQEEEALGRQRLVRLFDMGLADLMTQHVPKMLQSARPLKSPPESYVSEKMVRKKGVLVEEIHQGDALLCDGETWIRDTTTPSSHCSTNKQTDGGALAANTLVELSVIADGDESSSVLSKMERPRPLCQETAETDVTTLSTPRLANKSSPRPVLPDFSEDGKTSNRKSTFQEAFGSTGCSKVVDVGSEVFERNSTSSNTLPITAINAAVDTIHATVSTQCSPRNFSDGDSEKTPSASRPDSSLSLGMAHQETFPLVTEQTVMSQKSMTVESVETSKDELGARDLAISGTSPPLSSTLIDMASRCDVGVASDLPPLNATRDKSKRRSVPFNRHVVPCSLKECLPCRKGEDRATLFSDRQANGNKPQMLLGGALLTSSTEQSHPDDVMFDRTTCQRCVEATSKTSRMLNTPPTTMGSPSSSSALSSTPKKVRLGEEKPLVYDNQKEPDEENVTLDSIEALESIDNWSRTVLEEEEGESETSSCTSFSQSSKVFVKADLGDAAEQQEASSTSSVGVARRDVDTAPDISLSTMLETTAAASFDHPETEDRWMTKKRPFDNLNEVTSLSSSLSSKHNVSANTGRLIPHFSEDAKKDDHMKHGKRGDSFDSPQRSDMQGTECFGDCHTCSLGCCYSSSNYMRPTMSWRRRHEELEWIPLRRVLRDSGNGMTRDKVVRMGSRQWQRANTPTQRVTRVPFEEGPGVWMDAGMPRRPFGFDVLGNRAYKTCDDADRQRPIARTICSPTRRRDASYRFMAEGCLSRNVSHAGRSVSSRTNATLVEGVEEKLTEKERELVGDASTLATLCGIVEQKSPSPRRGNDEKKSTGSRPRAATPSYVEAFYKLDQKVTERRRFLAALGHGPVLQDLTSAAVIATPHRSYCPHHKRRSESRDDSGLAMNLLFGKSHSFVSRSSQNSRVKPWR